MKFYITDTGSYKEIRVKSWDDLSQSWGPDQFYDLEPNFPAAHRCEDGVVYCTEEEYNDLVTWWVDEIDAMNNCGAGHDDDDFAGCDPANLTLLAV